ncbi:MAG TPA: CHASE2 domain-containing protein, partial [Ignavibacteriaceae bacterium]
MAVLYFFGDTASEVNRSIETVFSKIKGESEPDTSIVIIHITSSDIERLGPWPIKRSYYALLINSLTSQQVKKIGLEIFLSSRLVTQSIYEDLLRNEILKSGKVVLGSKAGKITELNGIYVTDSLSYPSPKLLDENIPTGHLNFYIDKDLIIPNEIVFNNIHEQSFAQKILGGEETTKAVPVNYISSWQKFRNYSITGYFNLLQTSPATKTTLKDKIIIIGISDEQIAYNFQTPYDERMPGVALHAFAVDNLMNSRYFRYNFYFISIIVFSIIIILLIFLHNKSDSKKYLYYGIELLIFFLVTYFIFNNFYLKLGLAYFILPFLSFVIIDGMFSIVEYRNTVKGVMDESEILKSLVQNKQNELTRLQKELDVKTESGSALLVEKIKTLKNEIERLKENEEDKLAAELIPENTVKDFFGMIYSSRSMASAVDLINKASPTNSTILIIGESGTGKELAANAIHSLSQRKNKNFVVVNCGALS